MNLLRDMLGDKGVDAVAWLAERRIPPFPSVMRSLDMVEMSISTEPEPEAGTEMQVSTDPKDNPGR